MDTTQNTEPTASATQEPAKLTINELHQVAVVINLAVKRGAFDADEVGAVSDLYKKVKAFVEQFNKPAESTEQK